MKKCIIFCAGEFSAPVCPIGRDDYIVAADGGLAHTQRLGLTPHCILGDFDSLGYVPEHSICFPVEKDDTDALLAIRHGLDAGCDTFLLYGSLDGPRLDHTVANFQALQFLADRGARGYLIGSRYIATVVKSGKVAFPPSFQGILSAFCMGPDAQGVTLTGFKYTLENGTLTAGHPLGVSNHFTGVSATVSVAQGSLLLLYDRKNGLPE